MRILTYEIQGKTHAVTTLTVHLEGGQMVVFQPNDDPDRVLGRAGSTKLTSFFELCASPDPENEFAKTMLYQEIPKAFSWDAKAKVWVRRKKYQAAIGRLIHVSPMDRERFYLCLLLCHRKGPTLFENLRTVDGVVHPTFQAAAMHSGFLENDQEWIACMSEASAFRMPYQLRQLFATLLVYSQVSDVRGLWDQFYDELARDVAYKYRNLEGQTKQVMIPFHTLKSLNDLLQISGQAVAGFDLPQLSDYPTMVLDSLLEINLIRREREGYDHSVLQDVDDHTDELNEGQRAIYDLVLGAIAIAVASSGIAASLLMGGRTAHSTFKIPLKLDEKSVCSIHKQSKWKKLFQEASLIIWDEAPMTHRHAFEAVDRSLRDVLNNDEDPFGGKTVVLSGDFRQILPVAVRGTPAETIDACLKSSHLWSHFRQIHLSENMRVRAAHSAETAAELAAFSEFLLQVGEGRHEVNRQLGRDYMTLPRSMLIDDPPEEEFDEEEVIAPGAIPSGLKRLIDVMYRDVNNQAIATDEYFANRTILTTTNVIVHRIKDAVASRLDGDAHEYRSIDKLQDDED
ncbi:unnamed protein product [Phytophthora fragariaefolia]|uniref:ATP-dependent DNA helicase n=1 Tax=Phytophthora fragariaefolia TaxID=1490495 RepID=A0A9W6Y367_9STRA|nr:unnamed protein product [Phytophthora fragariaefolia]